MSKSEGVRDEILVERARRGESDAFGELVRRHLRAAYAVALARVRRPADAEDICQEAFVIALERLEECRRPERFGAWLISIVRNRAIDWIRHRSVRDAAPLAAADEARADSDPHREAERSELRERLLAALGTLSEGQREVVLLYDFEGWSHREIGRRLGISEGAARVRLHEGRRNLRRELGESHGDES